MKNLLVVLTFFVQYKRIFCAMRYGNDRINQINKELRWMVVIRVNRIYDRAQR